MKKPPTGCLYACGIPNVFLDGYALPGAGSVHVEQVAALHDLILIQAARQPGPLTAADIRFIWMRIGCTPLQFATRFRLTLDVIRGIQAGGTVHVGQQADVEIRRAAYQCLGRRPPNYRTLRTLYAAVRPDGYRIVVKAAPGTDEYWRLAA